MDAAKKAKRGLKRGAGNGLRRSPRWTGARREAYFAVLAETGNAAAAAAAIGMDRSTLRHRRKRDPDFARDHEAALAAADERLAQGGEEIALDPFETIRPGPSGRLQIVAIGKGRWSGAVEQRFLALLRENGNMSASARAVGFTPETVFERRRQWPAFAAAIEAVLEDAELALELRLATAGNNVAAAGAAGTAGAGTAGEGAAAGSGPQPFDPEFALKFLKWREEKRRGGGRRGRWLVRPEPTIEEVRDELVRRVAAIRRHREQCGTGDRPPGEGGEGDPPQ